MKTHGVSLASLGAVFAPSFGMLLAIAHEWQPRAGWERSMTLLSREVLPLLAKGRSA